MPLPKPRCRKNRDAAPQESTVPVRPELTFVLGPSEAGDNFYYPPLCANLKIKCEPDGDIEHQRQVTVCVCVCVCVCVTPPA